MFQLYISDIESKLPRPVKELKDFQKIFLLPDEEKEVVFREAASLMSKIMPQKLLLVEKGDSYRKQQTFRTGERTFWKESL